MFVLWCHGNPGGWQFSYRYAVVLIPWMFLLLVENGPVKISPIECALFSVSVAINAAATYEFLWTKPHSSVNLRPQQLLWALILALGFVLSVPAVLRGGYIGPDYYTHFARLTEWPKIFDFSTTSPPMYYLLGHWLFLLTEAATPSRSRFRSHNQL
jgi:hypothetical protein